MIVELVAFACPPGWTREQIVEDARHTIAKWQSNAELIRKHYVIGEDGSLGGIYLWRSKEAAQRGHDAAWQAAVERRTGARPTIRYFDLTMILDNEAGTVVEFPPSES